MICLSLFLLLMIYYNYQLLHPPKQPKRKTIPKKIREQVWKNMHSNQVNAICQVCLLTNISCFNFHVGHIVSRKKGGKDELSNYQPICSTCNLSMGAEHLDDYKKRLQSFL